MKQGRTRIFIERIAVVVAVIAFWELAAGGFGLELELVRQSLVPRPTHVLPDIVAYAESGFLVRDMASTIGTAMIGLVLGVVSGALVGLLFGYSRHLAAVMEPLMVALNSLPRITIAPLLILWFGLGITSKIVLSVFMVFFIIFFNTYLGVRSVDGDLMRVVKVMGGTRMEATRMVVIPSVASWVFAALRTCVSFSITAVVVGEFVGATQGLGYRLVLATALFQTTRVFSIMLILMVVGAVLVEIARRAENYLLRWRPAMS